MEGKMFHKIKRISWQILNDFKYIFLNYLVSNIPCWHIRRFFLECFGMKIGRQSRIHMKCTIVHPKGIEIGDRTTINEHCYLDGRGGLKIGNDSSISIFSMLITGSHDKKSSDFAYVPGKIEIGDNVWLGARAIILQNSIIHNKTVIGAGSVFKGTSEENTVYYGIPAKKVGNRELREEYHLTYRSYFR